jgi:DNA-nicking Smr family endonuclease
VKKKEKTPPKEKPFSASPFRELKGLRVEPVPEPPESRAPKPKPGPEPDPREGAGMFLREMAGVKRLGGMEKNSHQPEPTRREQGDDQDLAIFLREMTDVRRLHATTDVPRPKQQETHPLVRKLEAEESRLFLESLKDIQVRFHDEIPEEAEPLHPVSVGRMKRLKRGDIRINLELDLHGLTREEALESLSAFISSAWRHRQEAVLVITGKGNKSPGEPVLQGAVASWLREAGKAMVAEFSPAPGKMGGTGAFVVFFKENPAPQRDG